MTLWAKTARDSEWALTIYSEPGDLHALTAYADARDVWSTFVYATAEGAFDSIRGPIMDLGFVDARGRPRAARREVEREGWELATPAAYPRLSLLNTPGSGISQAQARDLVDLLRSVTAFVDEHRRQLEAGWEPPERHAWQAPVTGVRLEYCRNPLSLGDVDWPNPDELAPCCATGEGAEPEAALEPVGDWDAFVAQEAEVVYRYAAWLLRRGADHALTADLADTSDLFVSHFLADHHGVPLSSITEYDLRIFLYEWYPTLIDSTEETAATLLSQLAPFFTYIAEEEAIECPWAAEILAGGGLFMGRWRRYPHETLEPQPFSLWHQQVFANLRRRLLVPPPMLERDELLPGIGAAEVDLSDRHLRLWLLWRDEIVNSGVSAPEAVRDELEARHRAWVRTPLGELGGRTPEQFIIDERARLADAAKNRTNGLADARPSHPTQ